MDASSNEDILAAIAEFEEDLNNEDVCYVHVPNQPAVAAVAASIATGPASTLAEPSHTDEDEIVSVAWSKGTLAVAHFRIASMEMSVADETFDLQPDYPLLRNLFRTTAMRNLIASGPPGFLQLVAQLSGLQPDAADATASADRTIDLTANRMSRPNLVGSQFLHIYTNEEKVLDGNRRRILAVQLPVMQSAQLQSDAERQSFVGNLLPLHQPLVVLAAGNLLLFLDANWRYVYLVAESRVQLTDLRVHRLNDAVLMDESTGLALQIFSPSEQHPSGLKKGTASTMAGASCTSTTKEGLSLYAALGRHCSSRCGLRALHVLMLQPTQVVAELRERHATIEWCAERLRTNASLIEELSQRLRAIANPSEIYLRLMSRGNRPTDWRLLQRAAVNIYKISVLCEQEISAAASASADASRDSMATATGSSEMIRRLASGQEKRSLKNMLCAIYKVMDIAMSLRQGAFAVREGFDAELDEMRAQMMHIKRHLLELCQVEVAAFPDYVGQCVILYFEHFGFLLGVSVPDARHEHFLATVRRTIGGHFHLMHQDASCMYFQTGKSKLFNDNYGTLYLDIVAREKHIGQRLLGFVYESVQGAQLMAGLCAKLDCMLAMARLAGELQLVRPQVLPAPAKGMHIKAGRHILLQHSHINDASAAGITGGGVPNDTRLGDVGNASRHRIVVLNASNAAGKSVYLKQVGLIAYMAHIGCYVPAAAATIGCLDGIYTRIYSLECTHQGGSAFLNDLRQMSRALQESSGRSLILIDEFGKGTNALEGRAILMACLEHLLGRAEAAPLTLVSTHYRDVAEGVQRGVSAAVTADGWRVLQQSFEMRREPSGMLRSTYRLVEGVGPAEYAQQCGEVAQEMREIMANPDKYSDKVNYLQMVQ